MLLFFFFQAEDGIRDYKVTGVQTCALPIYRRREDVRLRPRFFRDALGQLEVIPGLHEDHLNAFGLRSEERREGKSVDLGGRRIIKKKKKLKAASTDHT